MLLSVVLEIMRVGAAAMQPIILLLVDVIIRPKRSHENYLKRVNNVKESK